MLFAVLISAVFAGQWSRIGGTASLSTVVEINNDQNVCVEVTAPDSCTVPVFGDYSDDIYMPFLGFSKTPTCAASGYVVTCSDYPDTTYDLTYLSGSCGTATIGVKTMTDTDCELAIPDASLPAGAGAAMTYRFMPGGNLWDSNGIEESGCMEALLPSTCGGVDMTTAYTNMGGEASSCDQTTYSTECIDTIDTSAYNSLGPCGTASFSMYFSSSTDCDAAAAAAQTMVQEAQAATDCQDADSVLSSDLSCADGVKQVGCNAAVAVACPSLCSDSADCGSSANMLTIGLAVLLALLFAF